MELKTDIEPIESFTYFGESTPVILQKHQFLKLETAIKVDPIRDTGKPIIIEQCALDIIRIYGKDTDFSELADQHCYFKHCLHIVDFDYKKWGSITIQPQGFIFEDNYIVLDGNHRCLTLAVLMLSERIDFKPISANLVIL